MLIGYAVRAAGLDGVALLSLNPVSVRALIEGAAQPD